MAITLGSLTFEDDCTTVRERYAETGGRDARIVEISGAVLGEHTADAIEDRLDAVLAAASDADYGTALSLRPGRRLWVRRASFTRETAADRLVGSFELRLDARDPFEESSEENTITWAISASGVTQPVPVTGNAEALPVITLTASGNVVRPQFSDGVRMLLYDGVVQDGSVLMLDSAAGMATLDGEDVTAYTQGAFVRLAPPSALLTYTDDEASSHAAAVTVAYRDRWW